TPPTARAATRSPAVLPMAPPRGLLARAAYRRNRSRCNRGPAEQAIAASLARSSAAGMMRPRHREGRFLRIFAAGLGTETNSFSRRPAGMRGFGEYLRLPAGQRLEAPQEASAVPWAAQEYAARNGATALIGPTSFAMPAGPTLRHVYEALRDELLAALQAALPVDVIAYSLHGAMIAAGYDDCEGDLLARTRALVGPGVAVGCLLDLHCHVS